jgi:hypothetical protein
MEGITMSRLHGVVLPIMALAVVAMLTACAGGPPEDQPGPPPGMETTAPAAEGAAPTLHGKAPSGYVNMEIAGLGGGGIGVSKLDASGEVYNLTDLAQFEGAYGEGRYGAVVGDASTGDLWLENNDGVVMHLKAKREGLMLSLGADVVEISMSQ